MTLEQRFTDFLRALPGSECLDDPGVMPSGCAERADFALFERSLIVEKKSLQKDPTMRVKRIVDEYRSHPDFPLIYGQVPMNRVLERLPAATREAIQERIAQRITNALEGAFQKADDQIASSKAALKAGNAGGLLVVLNDLVIIQSPNFLVYRIQQLLGERTPEGGPRFPHLDWVVAISEAHEIQAADGTWARPFLMMEGPPSPTSERTAGYLDYISYQWGITQDRPMLSGKVDAATLDNYRLASKD
jgi:hypothetical protein